MSNDASGSASDNPFQAPASSAQSSAQSSAKPPRKHPWRTTPDNSDRLPPGIPYIIGNEAAERFSFYGMRGILVVFMTQYLMTSSGEPDLMTENEANSWYHYFVAAAYAMPLLGSILADVFWGKYRTILWLSVVYCFGHLTLALDETRTGLMLGLVLISLGAGGIKPCVSAHVGDQFGRASSKHMGPVYAWFYFAINVGSLASSLLTPVLLDRVGPWLAFGVPGLLMFIATVVFWAGRYKFVHIPPAGAGFLREAFSRDGLQAIARLLPVFFFVAVFFTLYDQTGSSWVFQAERMNRDLTFGLAQQPWEILPSQVQALNPFLILAMLPLFTYVVYPIVERRFRVTLVGKMAVGFVLAAAAWGVSTWIETRLAAGATPHVMWQGLAYVILTAAEILISQVGLEFSYSQAPKTMKSFIMSLFFLSFSMGNLFTAMINKYVFGGEHAAEGAADVGYYYFFLWPILVAAVVFVFVAKTYRSKVYLQGDDDSESDDSAATEGPRDDS